MLISLKETAGLTDKQKKELYMPKRYRTGVQYEGNEEVDKSVTIESIEEEYEMPSMKKLEMVPQEQELYNELGLESFRSERVEHLADQSMSAV